MKTCQQAIEKYYGIKRAKRSQVLYINHINEGIRILDRIEADEDTKDAFRIHPIIQTPDEIRHQQGMMLLEDVENKKAIELALEYRTSANAYLSYMVHTHEPKLSSLPQVNKMLIADKVQNLKDFEKYHEGIVENSNELDIYFHKWLQVLGVSELQYIELSAGL